MTQAGTVHALFIAKKGRNNPVDKVTLHLDLMGIVGDKHYGSAPERTVLISSLESYTMVKEALGVSMPYGYLGENLLIDYNPYHLPLGTRLQIGSVLLEITQNCTLCNHLAALDKRIPKLLKHDRGVFAKVIEAGEVHVNDKIVLYEREEETPVF